VDQHGVVLDILVQERRNATAAKEFFKRLLAGREEGWARHGPGPTPARLGPVASLAELTRELPRRPRHPPDEAPDAIVPLHVG
jgi:DDE domain